MLRTVPLLCIPLLCASSVLASFECKFSIDSHYFDLSPLKGTHTTWNKVDSPPSIVNTTIFVDLCEDLTWNGDAYGPDDRCPDGTQGWHVVRLGADA
jgi:Autophagy-related protein 27